LIDEILKGEMPAAAIQFANRVVREGREIKRTNAGQAAVDGPVEAFFETARARIAKEHRGFPAPMVISECVEAAVTLPFSKGVAARARVVREAPCEHRIEVAAPPVFRRTPVTKIPDVPEGSAHARDQKCGGDRRGHHGRRHRDETSSMPASR